MGLRVAAGLAVGALLAAACSGGGGDVATSATAPAPAPSATADGDRDCSSAFYWEHRDCPLPPLVATDDIQPYTGVDSIPPVDDPRFESVEAAAEWLEPDSSLLVVEVEDEVRGYPVAILVWHEVVNDTVGGVPVVVTYCPLCNSGLVFERTVDGEVLDFGTSGHLFRSNLVMYDRQHENFWLQLDGRAIAGEPFTGTTRLERVPSQLMSLDEFTGVAPGAPLLSRDTGFEKDYGRNPYRGYDDPSGRPAFYDGPVDDRLAQMTRIVGVDGPPATAVPLDVLRERRVVEVDAEAGPVSVWWAPGQASALEGDTTTSGRDVGQTIAVSAIGPDGRRLRFEPAGETTFRDVQTGSTWDLRGRATAGPLEGARLEQVPSTDTFWFAWYGFHTDTAVAPTGAPAPTPGGGATPR